MKPGQQPGSLLNSWRRLAGLSQAEVAAAVGVSRVAISHWETGRSAPNGSHLHALFGVLGLAPNQRRVYIAAIADRGQL